jgi:hypothetical protein
MNRDGPDTRLGTTRLETPVEVARFEWGTDPGRGYQPALRHASAAAALAAAWSFSRIRNAVTQIPSDGSATAARIDPLYG